ncbi:MAG: tetratricopeptide repeat protein [Pseudomonadota bacterium]
MLFWIAILLVSLVTVIGVGAPLVRILSSNQETEEKKSVSGFRMASLILLVAAPIAAAAIYMTVGAPYSLAPEFEMRLAAAQQSPTEAIEAMPAEERAAMIESMVSGLAARLEENPDDPDGWRMLARSYGALGRAAESADAYRQLVARAPDASAEDWRNYATAMLAARGPGPGPYSKVFLDALKTLQGFNEDDPLALFYLGLVAREEGDAAGALQHWRRLAATLPEDAPIKPQLQGLIDEAEAETGAQ